MTSLDKIIKKTSDSTGISKSKVRRVITKTFSQIEKELDDDNNVMLRGFMKFVKAKRNTKAKKENWSNYKTKLK